MAKLVAKRPPTPKAPAPATVHSTTITGTTLERIFGLGISVARERQALLTRRELQVATLMAEGQSNRQIAEQLGISIKTLDIHRGNAKGKLAARTTVQLANLINLLRLAEKAGL